MSTGKATPVFLALCMLLSNVVSVNAQENNPLINSGDVIKTGTNMHDSKEYKAAIREYQKISRSDTNYARVLHEISYSHYADSQMEKSLEYAKLGLQLFPQRFSDYSMLAANAVDDLKRPDEAIKFYDSAIARDVHSSLLYFNKAVVLYQQKSYADAKTNLEKALLLNPFHPSSHYYVGKIYELQGNLPAAMLAYQTYLLVAPDGRYFRTVIQSLSDIALVTDKVLENLKNKKASKTDNFSLQQDILLSKIALDKQYKLRVALEDDIVRQIQVTNEKLEYIKNDPGFAMQFYVPFFTANMREEQFEPMIFSMFSGVDSKVIQNWNKDNQKKHSAFVKAASAYFERLKTTKVLDLNAREKSTYTYFYDNGYLVGKGDQSADKEQVPLGRWEYFYSTGIRKAAGSFNNKGNKEGTWEYFHENGKLKERTIYKDDQAEGLSEGWYNNGNKWFTETFVNGKLNGMQLVNYYNELPSKRTMLKDDLKDGEQKLYTLKGLLKATVSYSADKLEGPTRNYYEDGKIKNEMVYKNDLEEGRYKSYFESGKLNMEGDFAKGLRQGLWTTYYEDGSIAEKTTYLDNEITGEFTEYHKNGKLSRVGNYYKKKIDGKLSSFDDDGKVFSETVYEKGRLREIRFLDKSGNVISTTTTRKGAANIIFYSADGIKQSEGFFDKEGNRNGKFTWYYNNGKVSEESEWKSGEQDGMQTSYYANGKVRKTTSFTAGTENGYFKDYNANGSLNSEGWIVDGQRQQNFLYYNKSGKLTTNEYYLNNDLDGYSITFDPSGKKTTESKYSTGWINSISDFDTSGRILTLNQYENGHGPFGYKFQNGKVAAKGSYNNYLLSGPLVYYYFDGSVSSEAFYKLGDKDSTYKFYYHGGKLQAEGKYHHNEREGIWKNYFPDGKISEERNFVNGLEEGISKVYKNDGTLEKTLSYKDGELDGPYDFFAAANQLAVRLNYKANELKSYQYEVKPGSVSEPILVKSGSGMVEAKYPNGKISYQAAFNESNGEGIRKIFYPNGNIYFDGIRLNGFNEGNCKTYYANAVVKEDENYLLGELHGLCRYYYSNGKMEREENYYEGSKHGISKYFDEQGKLKKTETHYYGILQSIK
ncbi:MAG: tetratricopeptide repeat protein [Ferruginibacter sp.]|nr:tetratricopeptide repeat protein [Ferruginibacter sp.]